VKNKGRGKNLRLHRKFQLYLPQLNEFDLLLKHTSDLAGNTRKMLLQQDYFLGSQEHSGLNSDWQYLSVQSVFLKMPADHALPVWLEVVRWLFLLVR